jgi:hypothetical protein
MLELVQITENTSRQEGRKQGVGGGGPGPAICLPCTVRILPHPCKRSKKRE